MLIFLPGFCFPFLNRGQAFDGVTLVPYYRTFAKYRAEGFVSSPFWAAKNAAIGMGTGRRDPTRGHPSSPGELV